MGLRSPSSNQRANDVNRARRRAGLELICGWAVASLVATRTLTGCGGGAAVKGDGGSPADSTLPAPPDSGGDGKLLYGGLTAKDIGWARMFGRSEASVPAVRWARHLSDGSFVFGGAVDKTLELFGPAPSAPSREVPGPKYVAKLDALGTLLWATTLGDATDSAWLGATLLGDGSVAVLARTQKPGDEIQIIPSSGGPLLSAPLPLPCAALAGGLDGTILAVGQYAPGDDLDPGPGVTTATGPGGFVLVLSAATGVPRTIHLFPSATWVPPAGIARTTDGAVVVVGLPQTVPLHASLATLDLSNDSVVAHYDSTDPFQDWVLRADGRAAIATFKSADPGVCVVVDVDVHTGTMLDRSESPGNTLADGLVDRQGQSVLWSNRSNRGNPEVGQLRTLSATVSPGEWEWLLVLQALQSFDAVLVDPDGTVLFFGSVFLDAGQSTLNAVWPAAIPYVASSTSRYYYVERIGP
jgi:hypothetical protein